MRPPRAAFRGVAAPGKKSLDTEWVRLYDAGTYTPHFHPAVEINTRASM